MQPDLRVVFCGTALGTRSAEVKAYYAGRGNRFWATMNEIDLTPRQLRPEEYRSLLDYGIGLTDVCKTRSGSDEAVGKDAFDIARLVCELQRYSPAWIAFNGKNAARAALGRDVVYGRQTESFAGLRTFVLPSTSGAARRYWDIRPWRELAEAVSA